MKVKSDTIVLGVDNEPIKNGDDDLVFRDVVVAILTMESNKKWNSIKAIAIAEKIQNEEVVELDFADADVLIGVIEDSVRFAPLYKARCQQIITVAKEKFEKEKLDK